MLCMFLVIFARPIILEFFLKPAFSLETSEISVEIDTVYLLLCDLNLISFRRIRAFIRYVRKIMKSIFLDLFDPSPESPEAENLGSIPGAGIIVV